MNRSTAQVVALLALVPLAVLAGAFLGRSPDGPDPEPPATVRPLASTAPATAPTARDGAPEVVPPTSTIVAAPGPPPDTRTGPPATLAVPAGPTVPPEVPMDQLLLDEAAVQAVVPRFALAPDDLLGTGPIDLVRAAAAEADAPAERALLETRGFVEGFSRAFGDGTGDVVYLQVYRLADTEQAARYLLDGADTILSRGGSPYEVPGLPGALAVTQEDRSGDGVFTAHSVAFTLGDLHLLVVVGSPQARRTPAEAAALAGALATQLSGLAG